MKGTRLLGILLLAGGLSGSLLAGLAVGPDYKRPATPSSSNFTDAELGTWKEATPADAIARGNWWAVFNDPVLDELEREAAANNQDLKAAVARVTQARALARNAKAEFFPSLTLAPSASRGRTSANDLNPTPTQLGNDFRVPSDLLERRPDIAEAERSLAAANARIGVAKAAFFPVVRLTGVAGFESMDVDTLFNWQSRVWSVGPSITLPLFQGGRNRANLKRSQAVFEENVANYRQRILVAFKEVQDTLTGARLLSQQEHEETERKSRGCHRGVKGNWRGDRQALRRRRCCCGR